MQQRGWRSISLEIVNSYADDFTLRYFGDNPFTGDHVGKQAALDTLLEVGTRAPRTLLSIDEIMAGPLSAVMGRANDPPTDKMAPCTSAPIGCRSVP